MYIDENNVDVNIEQNFYAFLFKKKQMYSKYSEYSSLTVLIETWNKKLCGQYFQPSGMWAYFRMIYQLYPFKRSFLLKTYFSVFFLNFKTMRKKIPPPALYTPPPTFLFKIAPIAIVFNWKLETNSA
jgi:hypothetical protein